MLASAATVLRATYHHPYQMHGSIGSPAPSPTSGPTAPRCGRRPSRRIRLRNTTAAILGLTPESVACHLHPRRGLLRHQRRRHGDLRRRGALAGHGQARARAALATRTKWRGRTTGTSSPSISVWVSTRAARSPSGTTRPGLRRRAGGPATTRQATSSPVRSWVSIRRRSIRGHRRLAPTNPLNNGSNTAPSYIAGRVGAHGTGRASFAASACSRIASIAVLHRTAAGARAAAEHVRARVASWTKSPRTSRRIRSTTGYDT